MPPHIVVLGAGFGGLELAATLSDALHDDLNLTLIDAADHFVFGFSKLDLMFGHKTHDAVRHHYRDLNRPGVTFKQERITSIDPTTRRVTTSASTYDADILVIALGADYDIDATPGLAEAGNEFYSVAGAQRLRDVIPTFTSGRAIVGVTSTPFKCPPAPSEAALLLHDHLVQSGHRDACEIAVVMPFAVPIPPAPDASRAILAAFAERNITFVPDRLVRAIDPATHAAVLDNGDHMPFDLFLGIPKHRVPGVVAQSGLTEDGWIPVDRATLQTKYPNVYAVGDVTSVGTPKAGVFSEGAARIAAQHILAQLRGDDPPPPYNGAGACYLEFGQGAVARVDVDFFTGPTPTGSYTAPTPRTAEEKHQFGTSRHQRWFGA